MSWKDTIGSVAPTIASMLGGPLAGVATSSLLKVLGIESDAPAEVIETRMNNLTTDDLKAIKEAEFKFKVDMKELDIQADNNVLLDKQSARNMKLSTGDVTVDILAGIVVIAWIAINVLLLTVGTPDGLAEPVLYRILGTLDASLVLVLSFFFGSSRKEQGSKP